MLEFSQHHLSQDCLIFDHCHFLYLTNPFEFFQIDVNNKESVMSVNILVNKDISYLLQGASLLVEVKGAASLFLEEWTTLGQGLVLHDAAVTLAEVRASCFLCQDRATSSFLERTSAQLLKIR